MRSHQILLGLAACTAVQSSQLDASVPMRNVLRSGYVIPEEAPAELLPDRSIEGATLKRRQPTSIPIKVTNNCQETIWPAFASQAGTGPATNGFELDTGKSKSLSVGADWQGRIWGRTNCSFNAEGTGASNLNGNNGAGAACGTGDCNGVLNCVVTVSTSFAFHVSSWLNSHSG